MSEPIASKKEGAESQPQPWTLKGRPGSRPDKVKVPREARVLLYKLGKPRRLGREGRSPHQRKNM